MTRRRLYLVLLVLWVAFTFLLTSIPIPDLVVPVRYVDKLAHFGFYAVMGFLCAMWRRESADTTRSVMLASLAFAAFIGAADEAHQHWIPGRSVDIVDWLADAAGGGTGALFSSFLPHWLPFLRTE